MENAKILIADDDAEILGILEILLAGEGYEVVKAHDGREAAGLAADDVDLYILDVGMPEMSGFAAAMQIRKRHMAPMMFLTAYSGEADRELGFSAGADDYMVKPFSNAELLLKVKALLRRSMQYSAAHGASTHGVSTDPQNGSESAGTAGAGVFADARRAQADAAASGAGTDAQKDREPERKSEGKGETADGRELSYKDIVIDLDGQMVRRGDEMIRLTYTEFRILELFVKHPKKIFSMDNIYSSIWEDDVVGDETIMVHIKNLRKKLGDNSRDPRYIKTAWGKGYYVD